MQEAIARQLRSKRQLRELHLRCSLGVNDLFIGTQSARTGDCRLFAITLGLNLDNQGMMHVYRDNYIVRSRQLQILSPSELSSRLRQLQHQPKAKYSREFRVVVAEIIVARSPNL